MLAEAAVEEFEVSLRGEMLRHGDEGYDAARTVFNAMIDRHPSLIIRCAGVANVISAVNFRMPILSFNPGLTRRVTPSCALVRWISNGRGGSAG